MVAKPINRALQAMLDAMDKGVTDGNELTAVAAEVLGGDMKEAVRIYAQYIAIKGAN